MLPRINSISGCCGNVSQWMSWCESFYYSIVFIPKTNADFPERSPQVTLRVNAVKPNLRRRNRRKPLDRLDSSRTEGAVRLLSLAWSTLLPGKILQLISIPSLSPVTVISKSKRKGNSPRPLATSPTRNSGHASPRHHFPCPVPGTVQTNSTPPPHYTH